MTIATFEPYKHSPCIFYKQKHKIVNVVMTAICSGEDFISPDITSFSTPTWQ